jgi:hypothetical protein
MKWREGEPVTFINTRHGFDHAPYVIDAKGGSVFESMGGGGTSSRSSRQYAASFGPVDTETSGVIFFDQMYFLMLSTTEAEFPFFYDGGDTRAEIGERFSWGDVEFMIEAVEIKGDMLTVLYSQLTPAAEVCVYQLNFVLSDRLGNTWMDVTDRGPQIDNPKRFPQRLPVPPCNNWSIIITDVVQVVPGLTKLSEAS